MANMGFQSEVSGIEQLNHCIWIVELEGLGARRDEERIVLAPNHQSRQLPGP